MNDYFKQLESQLALLTEAGAHLDATPVERRRRRPRLGALVASIGVAIALGVPAVILLSVNPRPTATSPAVHHRPHRPHHLWPDEILYPPSAVPTLRQLLQNFAILRRPQTASDRSWQPQCDCGGAARQLTGLTRYAATLPGGYRIFLDVEQFIDPGQLNMAAGSYVLNLDIVDQHGNGSSSEAFGPNTQYSVYPLSSGGPRASRGSANVWASIVPDGVAAASWTFGCSGHARTTRCGGGHPGTFTVPVVNNVAAREIVLPGTCDRACESAAQVTWRTLDGRVVSFSGLGNLSAPPFVKGWRGNPVLHALEPQALGDARLGQSASTAIQTLERLLGPPADPNLPVRDCGIDHEAAWTSPTVAEPLTIYERAGRFVGYLYGAPTSEIGLVREPGAVLETGRGLTLDDTVGTARRLYGTELATSAAHGGIWSAAGDGGTVHGSVLPTIYPLRVVTDQNPVATIGAGDTGCPPTSTP